MLNRSWCALVVMGCLWWPAAVFTQQAAPPAANALPPMDGAAKLTTELNVQGNVSVEAVLLPPNITRGLFGRAVSDRYAAIELIVSNRSHDAALIVHSIFLDYSRWAFSGTSLTTPPPCAPEGQTGSQAAKKDAPALPVCLNELQAWQASNKANQIAAAEYRIPRGTLFDAEPWTLRNWAIRIAETIGTVAAGFVFTVKEINAAKSVAAYNGNVLPALRALVPNSAVEQANRLSDLGFRVNTVVPKDSSDALVAFFPLDRFITPGIRELYQKSPAIFFVPQAMLFDPSAKTMLHDLLGVEPAEVDELKRLVRTDLKQAAQHPLMQVLNGLSLNNIHVIVGGTMTVDVDTVPATIQSVDFDQADPALLWAETGQKKGTIRGRYLSGGKLTIVNGGQLQISDAASITDGSTDETLQFQFTLNKAVPTGSKVTFRVDKTDKNQRTIEGQPFDYTVNYTLVTPAIATVERAGDALTISGQRFFSTDANVLAVTLIPGAVAGLDPKPVAKFDRKPGELKIDLAPLALQPACWTPQVTVGTMQALGATAFAQPPAPKMSAAKKSGTRIVVTGEQIVNLASCGKPLTFEIAEQAAGSAFRATTMPVIVSAKEASFDVPKAPADGKFKVRVLVGGVEADSRNVD